MKRVILLLLVTIYVSECRKSPVTGVPDLFVDSIFVNNVFAPNNAVLKSIDYNDVVIRIRLQGTIDTTRFNKDRVLLTGNSVTGYSFHFKSDRNELLIFPETPLTPLSLYRIIVNVGNNLGGIFYESYTASFRTSLDSTPKFPLISDDSLLTLVQKKTFGYFWDYAHPVSGLARERYGSGDIVTSGGSGFGLMAIITGIKRGFISRNNAFERIKKIVNFLSDPATDRFHGAYPHWLNGATGKVVPFSANDNGGDLVETAFLMEGLLTVRAYFKDGNSEEKVMCDSITEMWKDVDWNWYRHDNQDILYWHWSPNLGWIINMGIRGWNEALMVYVLAAASPTHSIPASVYNNGWARNGGYPMRNNKTFYGITLPLGEDYGGPLFFAHYSFLGLDPRNLTDQYASYWTQNVAHTRINHSYCAADPKGYAGYSEDCWGLTASDIQNGYSASSPANDLGVIAPTAALSSMPYTPVESMNALHFFYYIIGDRLWGDFGFHDAFNLTSGWFANSYISIDQGPIVCMIENYRSGYLWTLFMSDQDVRNGLTKLGFTF